MWTIENRPLYKSDPRCYPSDLSDTEWELIHPVIPPARSGGNKRTVDMRKVVNGLMYVHSTGCHGRAIPKDWGQRSTVYDYIDRWDHDGTLKRIHHTLYVQCREPVDREASPTAAAIDSQSVKSAEKGGPYRSERVRCGQENQWDETDNRLRRLSLVDTPVCCCTPSCMPRISRTVTAALCRWTHCLDCIRFC